MNVQEFVLTDREGELCFTGYKLGTVHVGEETITCYFSLADEDEPARLLTTEGESVREDHDEYSFLSYYGVRLTYPLVWAPPDWGAEKPADIPAIRDWF